MEDTAADTKPLHFVHLCKSGERVLCLPQSAETGAVVGLQGLLLGLLLTDQLFRGGTVHLGPVQLHCQRLVLFLLFCGGFLAAFDLSVK